MTMDSTAVLVLIVLLVGYGLTVYAGIWLTKWWRWRRRQGY